MKSNINSNNSILTEKVTHTNDTNDVNSVRTSELVKKDILKKKTLPEYFSSFFKKYRIYFIILFIISFF